MTEQQLYLLFGVLVLNAVLLIVVLVRQGQDTTPPDLARTDHVEKSTVKLDRSIHEQFTDSRREQGDQATSLRREVHEQIATLGKTISDTQEKRLDAFSETLSTTLQTQNQRLTDLSAQSQSQQELLRQKVDEKLGALSDANEKKLDEMRKTVDEKLQGTLEKRLGKSFNLVSERLKEVHQGLGQMHELANGVGDLKRVLTNVKTRGGWGEVQLENLLDDFLAPGHWERNVQVKPRSRERVDFAIKLPGHGDDEAPVWLPIDSKFPKEDYERLLEAAELGDHDAVEKAEKSLLAQIRKQARDISQKYIAPPNTTDFAVMFLPTEGLYAEIARRPDISQELQRDHRILFAGPQMLTGLLSSLQMGFRTLAIQQRSSEVWRLLASVKKEFETFGGTLEKVRKKLDEAIDAVTDVDKRRQMMGQRLRDVETLPDAGGENILSLASSSDDENADEASSADEGPDGPLFERG